MKAKKISVTPRTNQQVEKFNKIIMLAKLSKTFCKWNRVLERVKYSLNNIYHATATPARLLFSIEEQGNSNDLLRNLISSDDDSECDSNL